MSNFIKGDRKTLNAWAFYDWANSVYALVISSAIFPLFYGALFRIKGISSASFFGIETPSESIISYVTAIGFLFVAIASPVLSGVADYLGNKKFFLKLFCLIGSLSCMALYFFDLENFALGLFFYATALIGFWGSLVFYNSYLPDLALTEQQDAISAKGYSLGYVGSVILLVIILAILMNYKTFGFENELVVMRVSFLLVGIWWLGFSQYTYKNLPNFRNKNKLEFAVFFSGIKELKSVYNKLSDYPSLKKFLTAFFVYSMAVQTVMIIAAYFGEKEVQWANDEQRTSGLIISILLIQLIAVLGAVLTSKISKKFGNVQTLIGINLLWILICVYAYFVQTPFEFYIAASCVGLVMGGIQSLSRSTYSKMLPDEVDTTSLFSFYDVTEKVGIVIGMLMYGLVTQVTGRVQNAILFLVIFFILGVFLLLKLKKIQKN